MYVLCAFAAFGVLYWVCTNWNNPVRPAALAKLHRGMSEDEVKATIGNPSETNKSDGTWYYEKGWSVVRVFFDSAHKMDSYEYDP